MSLLDTLSSNAGWILGTVLLFLAFLGSLRYAASRYKKVPPSRVGIIYGRKQTYDIPQPDGTVKTEKLGFRLLTGGGSVVLPFIEDYAEMDLGARLIPLAVAQIPTQGGVMIDARGTATVVIGTDTSSLITAARNFEGKKTEEINQIARENLEGQLRSILGTLTVEELIGDRKKLNEGVLEGAESELLKLGLRISILTIQDITDEVGYIKSLGKKRTAEVQRDATIGEAQATSQAKIAASNATKEAETVAAQNDVLIAEAKKDRDLKVAQFKAVTDREKAIAEQAGAIAAAEADKTVRQRRVEAEAAETTARIDLADQETARVEKELQFQVIKPAEARKQASVIDAEAAKQTGILQAEGAKQKKIIDAEAAFEAASKQAQATRTTAEAEGDAVATRGRGDAEAVRARLTAEADGEKAKRLATAAGTEAELKAAASGKEAELLAEAKGVEAKLLAEAKGKKELAIALAQLDQTGRLLQVLDAAPKVAEAIGDALAKALGPEGLANVFGQMAAPLGNVDSIRMYDFGSNNGVAGGPGGGGLAGALAKYANITPDLFFNAIAKAQALGFGPILEKFGLTSEILDNITNSVTGNITSPDTK